jgi:hypothetical protein
MIEKQYGLVGQYSGLFIRHVEYDDSKKLILNSEFDMPVIGVGVLPTPAEEYYAKFWIAPGIGDQTILYVCLKNVSGDYYWEQASSAASSISHSVLLNLDADDHTQYLTDSRGDIRYYTQTQLQTSGLSSVHWDNLTNNPDGKVLIDLFINRPLAGNNGRLFYATDTKETWVDDGTAWNKISVYALSDLTGSIDDVADGTTYGKVKLSELSTGYVTQINDSMHVVDAEEARDHIDDTSIHSELDDADTSHTKLWSSYKINDNIDSAIDGLAWQKSIISFWDASVGLPISPAIDDRYVCDVSGNGWTESYVYQYKTAGWFEIIPDVGFAILNKDDETEYVYVLSGDWLPRASVTHHDMLTGLQGGDTNEYYHLDANEHTEATQYSTDSLNGLMSSTDHGYLPTNDQKDALDGTDGTPSSTNKYVTNSDARMTDDRYPTTHATSHQDGGLDEISTSSPGANLIPKSNSSGNLNDWITSIDAATITSPDVEIKLMSGTRSEIDSGSLSLGEVAFATDTKEVFIGDGSNKHFIGKTLINTFANMPAFGTPGRYFHASDTGGLYLDDGTQWILCTKSFPFKVQELFIPVTYNKNYGNYQIMEKNAKDPIRFSFVTPPDFYSMISIKLMFIPAVDNSTTTATIDSSYATVGESSTNHTQSVSGISFSVTSGIVTEFDMAPYFTDLAANDIAGITIDFNMDVVLNILGFVFIYYKTI